MSASKALAEALYEITDHEVEVSIVDVLQETNRLGYTVVNLYNYFLTKSLIWNSLGIQLFYRLNLVKSGALLSVSSKSMNKLLERERPDIVLFTNPWIVGYVINSIERSNQLRPKTVSVVIDIGKELPPGWYNPNIDLFIVATEEAKNEMKKLGAADGKIKVLGMPVHPIFIRGRKERMTDTTRMKSNDKLHILVMGGREGTGNTFFIVKGLMKLCEEFHLTILCGRNSKLKEKVERYVRTSPTLIKQAEKHVIIRGYVTKVYPYMCAADLIITKAGALTVSEAVTLGVPLILDVYPTTMRQEFGNVEYFRSRGLGLIARTPQEVPGIVKKFIEDDKMRRRLILNLETSKDLVGTFGIARAILGSLPY